jgi:hypothetical protein
MEKPMLVQLRELYGEYFKLQLEWDGLSEAEQIVSDRQQERIVDIIFDIVLGYVEKELGE